MMITGIVGPIVSLVGELIQMALFHCVYVPITLHWWASQLLCKKQNVLLLIWALFFIMGSLFLQGRTLFWVLGLQLTYWLLWRLLNHYFEKVVLVPIFASVLIVASTLLFEGMFAWTPYSIIANIIIAPLLVIVRCRV
ncbi:MAG: hypothetical protein JW725_04035 [Candidatus Babeliaceae bacterium]|nr:hypothetical protein [Candidatus Babeliaceae bacterium]